QILPSPTIQGAAVVAMISLAMIFIAGGRPAAEIVPLLAVFAAAGFRLMPSLSRLSVALSLTRQHESVVEGVLAVLAEDPAAPAAEGAEVGFRSAIELDDLRFSYVPGVPVLDGVSLRVAHGSFVALAGGSGAGKTTLVDVLMGLLEPQSGRVVVDGKQVTPEAMPAWRRRIGYIPQTLFLFDDTIAANIAFATDPAKVDRERVAECARLAQLESLVAGSPQGLETKIGERGSRLSGGQRQRLGIARALYRDPDLLVMDESTSALDGITEAEILETLKSLRGRKTILVIAHRAATVREADVVVLLKGGRVAAVGSYDDLAAKDAHFAALMSHETLR
ncbi:MAG: ABC transporter ATP-binding protein, partial [Elusimicrobia bacterium]|nr:ABC transporter ATP-binding protein [Elusimicrobiota bacterium]